MNKKQAAEFLGLSVKSLERYTAQKRITVSYIKGSHGKEADYNQEELERLKIEIATNSLPDVAPAMEQLPTSLVTTKPTSPTILSEDGNIKLISLLETIVKHQVKASVSTGEKLTLSLLEAAQLAGLSRGYLRKAIETGELKAAKRGKGWNIKRSDLEMWVEGL